MDIQLIVLALYVFACAITAVCTLLVFRWARENSRARNALIQGLSNNLTFVNNIEKLQFAGNRGDDYRAEIARLQTMILEQMQELSATHAKLLKEAITQKSIEGRTGYIEHLAKDVKRTAHNAAV